MLPKSLTPLLGTRSCRPFQMLVYRDSRAPCGSRTRGRVSSRLLSETNDYLIIVDPVPVRLPGVDDRPRDRLSLCIKDLAFDVHVVAFALGCDRLAKLFCVTLVPFRGVFDKHTHCPGRRL